jgi:hypothetical protein
MVMAITRNDGREKVKKDATYEKCECNEKSTDCDSSRFGTRVSANTRRSARLSVGSPSVVD